MPCARTLSREVAALFRRLRKRYTSRRTDGKVISRIHHGNIRVVAITRRTRLSSYSRAYSRFPTETHKLDALVASVGGGN